MAGKLRTKGQERLRTRPTDNDKSYQINRPSYHTDRPAAPISDTMTAVAPAQQNTTTFRNDSISGPIAAQSPSVPGFRHFSNVGDGQDFKGRMSSIDGSQ